MNKQQKALMESIEHWKRMIAWVKKQDKTLRVEIISMEKAIGECWKGSYCALCEINYNFFLESCCECILKEKIGTCEDLDSYNVWCFVAYSQTWGEWLENAKSFLKQLESCKE